MIDLPLYCYENLEGNGKTIYSSADQLIYQQLLFSVATVVACNSLISHAPTPLVSNHPSPSA